MNDSEPASLSGFRLIPVGGSNPPSSADELCGVDFALQLVDEGLGGVGGLALAE